MFITYISLFCVFQLTVCIRNSLLALLNRKWDRIPCACCLEISTTWDFMNEEVSYVCPLFHDLNSIFHTILSLLFQKWFFYFVILYPCVFLCCHWVECECATGFSFADISILSTFDFVSSYAKVNKTNYAVVIISNSISNSCNFFSFIFKYLAQIMQQETQLNFFFRQQSCLLFSFELLYFEGIGCVEGLPRLLPNGTWCNLLLALTAADKSNKEEQPYQAPQGNLEKFVRCFIGIVLSLSHSHAVLQVTFTQCLMLMVRRHQ